jgi:hypothetical protein
MRLSLRVGATLAAGSLAVHQLRFLIGFGDDNAVGGHGYLTWLAPLLALALAGACGVWVARVGRSTGARPRTTLTWLGASASLVATYAIQETIEGLSSAHHPGLLAHGGWIALPAALAVGALVALTLRAAHAADDAAAVAAHPWSPLRLAVATPEPSALAVAAPVAPRPRILARRLAGRGPPLAS